MQFSANLGFLWTDRTLPEAILAAQAAGALRAEQGDVQPGDVVFPAAGFTGRVLVLGPRAP